jgi:hypothetical protein
MTFEEFLLKWNGEFCEIAGPTAINQCVDLANAYIRDVLGLPIIEWTNAKDFPSKADTSKYDYILNTATNFPKEGDIIIWRWGTAGHIAIVIEANVDKFNCFEQNNPIGTNCHVGKHTYSGVLGWLHPKQIINSDSLTTCQIQLQDEIKKKNDNYNWGKELETELEGAKAQIISHENNLKTIAITLKVDAEMPKILGEITKMLGYEDSVRQLTTKNIEQATSLSAMAQNNQELDQKVRDATLQNEIQAKQIGEQNKEIESLKQEHDEMQKVIDSTTTHESLLRLSKLSICKVVDNNG